MTKNKSNGKDSERKKMDQEEPDKVEIRKRIERLEKLPRKDVIAMVRRRGGPELADKAKREYSWALDYLAVKEYREKNQKKNGRIAPPKKHHKEKNFKSRQQEDLLKKLLKFAEYHWEKDYFVGLVQENYAEATALLREKRQMAKELLEELLKFARDPRELRTFTKLVKSSPVEAAALLEKKQKKAEADKQKPLAKPAVNKTASFCPGNELIPSPTLNVQTEPKVLMHGLNGGCEVKKEDFDVFAAKFGGRTNLPGYHSNYYGIPGLDGSFHIQEFVEWIIKNPEKLPEYEVVKNIFGPEYGPKIVEEIKFVLLALSLDDFLKFYIKEWPSLSLTQPDDSSVV